MQATSFFKFYGSDPIKLQIQATGVLSWLILLHQLHCNSIYSTERIKIFGSYEQIRAISKLLIQQKPTFQNKLAVGVTHVFNQDLHWFSGKYRMLKDQIPHLHSMSGQCSTYLGCCSPCFRAMLFQHCNVTSFFHPRIPYCLMLLGQINSKSTQAVVLVTLCCELARIF